MTLTEQVALLAADVAAEVAAFRVEVPAQIAQGVVDGTTPGIANPGPLRAYGNSLLTTTNGTCEVDPFNRLRKRLGSLRWVNNAVSGHLAPDIAAFAFGAAAKLRQGTADTYTAGAVTGAGTWTPTPQPGGVVWIEALGNDSLFDGTTTSGGTTAKSRAGAANALEAIMRLVRAGSARNEADASITYSAGWTSQAGDNFSGGSAQYTLTAGATATFTARNGDTVILLAVDASGAGIAGAAWSLTADGQPYKTGTTNDQMRRTNTEGLVVCQQPVHISGLATGDHTFVLTNQTGGGLFYLDSILRESPTPPTVIVGKNPQGKTAGYALGAPGAGPATDAIYHAIIDTVVNKFPTDGSVITYNPVAGGHDPTLHIGADGVHLNDAGADLYARNLFDIINALPARNGLVRL